MDVEITDDESITEDVHLLRRVPNWPTMVKFDENLQTYRPSSACFGDRDTGDKQVSVTHKQDLLSSNGTITDIIRDYPGFGVASVEAGFARSGLRNPQKLVRDPTDDDPHHCLIVGPKNGNDKKKLAKHASMPIQPLMKDSNTP